MITLGIETSCDETAAAVIKNGSTILSSSVSSSIHLHRKFGGIVPEIACRYHLEYIVPVTKTALQKANITFKDIDLIAITYAPGLVGSLLVGVSFGKALSFALQKPLIGVNHTTAHLFAAFSKKKKIHFPFIGLVVSGGHTSIACVHDFDNIKIIGKTRDDASGEAFDKVAKILGLKYPGGPEIDKLAKPLDKSSYKFSCAPLNNSLDFSFSGIKTEVLYTCQKLKTKNRKTKAEIAYAFQKAVVDTIVSKSIRACKKENISLLTIGGGVACNSYLRNQITAEAKKEKIELLIADTAYCLDNAAMIGTLGYHLYKKGFRSDYSLNASANA
ncbi:MAG: tRNA (adenosine(37)-N6)-threonylcarbamoyltransferase complex transferase subunit TsaD [Candidatus Omnitrophica bacterium]|nr:tRNA (adenosine(37)-N6)-threonylcarbamoyltransferase complex transferase subunit TsaD [Candidatus Omnitrophota bacterium]